MRIQKTLLVLGAGASQGFGLPLGSGLRNLIADDLNIMFDRDWGQTLESGSSEIVEALRILVRHSDGRNGDINPHRAAAIQISRSMRLSGSIDEYIERHKEDTLKMLCAKLAIAKAIVQSERNSPIYVDPTGRNDPFEHASESWLALMLRDLTRGLGKSDLPSAFENLTVVNFNYDRCVEHFAYQWFQTIYDLSESESADICKRIKIYHPYGSLGPLRYQSPNDCVPYGGEIDSRGLIQIADRIKTYSEAIDEHPSFLESDVTSANRVVFLGFGFHQQNVDLLGAVSGNHVTMRCYATTQGVRSPRIDLIKNHLVSAFNVESANGFFFEAVPDSCEAFWNEYGDVLVQ
jgi:hypothetical protein